ncbi:unnamed protein product [Strongylus vulgaris]|uniref:Uncharacterized protein n=1 Tax=Strongylus vulgaris TaxID=40348 RepID=A0A3P7KTT2_STRVU|nr:unnamed protein product [Strongylus vulgaris]
MTKSRTLLSLLKSLWLRSTGQPGWCDCIICRDEMLNLPDPLGFSQDAREFQKRLRKMPRTYKCKPCNPRRSRRHEKDEACSNTPNETQVAASTHISPHPDNPLPQTPTPSKTTKTVSFSEPLEQYCSPER